MKYPPTPPTTTPAHSLAAMGMDETAARLHVIAEGRGTKWLFERYGLAEDPFGMTPNPAYFYASRSHAEARSSLIVGVECGVGFHALIAPAGLGKTTLLLDLLQQYRDVARTAFLFQIQGDSRDFLRYLMSELKTPTMEKDFVLMQQAINELFLREVHAGR